MRILVIRHAHAGTADSEQWPDDSLRELSSRGKAEFARLCRRLARSEPAPEVVLASPYKRAWQTARILAREAGFPKPTSCQELTVEGACAEAIGAALVGELARGVQAVAAVGHEPSLSEYLCFALGSPEGSIRMRKGAVACIETPDPTRPMGQLQYLLDPSHFARSR